MAARRAKTNAAAAADPPAELGRARAHWDALLAHARAAGPATEVIWKSYAGNTGRQCVIRANDRNLAYLKPGPGRFLVSVALSDEAVAGLDDSGLPEPLIEEVRAAPRYPEGRPARITVTSAASWRAAMLLIDLKVADVQRRKPRTS